MRLLILAIIPGFFGGLMMSGSEQRHIACRTDVVELTSGEHVPCKEMTLLRQKGLWIIGADDSARVVRMGDVTEQSR